MTRHIGFELKRTGSNDILEVRVGAPGVVDVGFFATARFGVFFELVLWQDKGSHFLQERPVWYGQSKAHRVLVERLKLGADAIKVKGVVVATFGFWVDNDLVKGKDHIVGGEIHAVLPFDALAQLKGPDFAILRGAPGFGEGGFDLVGGEVVFDQAIKDLSGDRLCIRVNRAVVHEGLRRIAQNQGVTAASFANPHADLAVVGHGFWCGKCRASQCACGDEQ